MLDIVKVYKNLEYRFHRSCPDINGDISIDDSIAYIEQQEEFVRIARAYYSDDTLDCARALQRFRSDVLAQKELNLEEKSRCK